MKSMNKSKYKSLNTKYFFKIDFEIRRKKPNYELIVKYSFKILEKNPSNLNAWKCLSASLIFQKKEKEFLVHTKTKKFKKAANKDRFQILNFYQAYVLYRQSKYKETKKSHTKTKLLA